MINKFRNRFYSNLPIILLIALFICFMLVIVNRQGLWHDEIYTLSFMRGFDIYLFTGSDLRYTESHSAFWYKSMLEQDNFWNNLKRNLIHEGHPPLYYISLKLWSYIFGWNEIGLRSWSIFTSCISLCFAFKIGRIIDRNKAIIFPILLAFCPIFVYYSIEARSYSLYILLSIICLYYFLGVIRQSNVGSKSSKKKFILLLIYTILLLYTHYYGVFFYLIIGSILFFYFIKTKDYIKILSLILPLLLFSLWLPFIKAQTTVHHIHWTNGYLGFSESCHQYGRGIITLITSVPTDKSFYALWLPLISIVTLVFNYLRPFQYRIKNIMLGIVFVFAYGLSIIFFDKLLDHHTIAVPRYYLPLHVVFILALYYGMIKGKTKWISNLAFGGLMTTFIMLQYDYYNLSREPKQMYRQAAAYISKTYKKRNVELVISPSGPSTIGIAYYLHDDYEINSLPAKDMCKEYKLKNRVIIEQRLGLATEPWMLPCKADIDRTRIVRFVGLDVVNAN